MYPEIAEYRHSGILFSLKKCNFLICDNMDETGGHSIKLNIYYISIYFVIYVYYVYVIEVRKGTFTRSVLYSKVTVVDTDDMSKS